VLQSSEYEGFGGWCWATDGAANDHLSPTPRTVFVLTMQLLKLL